MPYILFAIATFVAALLTLLLPETLGKSMPQTVEEVVNPTYQALVNSDDLDQVITVALDTKKRSIQELGA